MPIDLQLPSGLIIRDAGAMLNAKFAEWQWENYDGVGISNPDRIVSADIDAVYQLGARSPRDAYKSVISVQGDAISSALSAIPQSALEDTDLSEPGLRNAVTSLINILADTKSIKLAGASKLVARFRPALLPVIDSVLDNYYWYAMSIIDECAFREMQTIYKNGTWGGVYLKLMEFMQADVRGAQTKIDQIRRACSDSEHAKASRVRVVESLIWYYYARGGLQEPLQSDAEM